jgi:NIMA (never in mitosis gene a)-related kinase
MPYCESGDLGKIVSAHQKSKAPLAEAQVIRWITQIALALHFLHESGVVHRDLKPCNVMLTEGGDLIKLADFGLALEVTATSWQGSPEAGTPYYTAPEMVQGLSYSYPVDCFSLGVLLYELLRLEVPFQGASTTDLVRSILNDEPPPLPLQYSEDIRYKVKRSK